MPRLILMLLLLVALAYAAAAVMKQATRLLEQAQGSKTEGTGMPNIVSKLAYVGLLVLMFGTATGWVGNL